MRNLATIFTSGVVFLLCACGKDDNPVNQRMITSLLWAHKEKGFLSRDIQNCILTIEFDYF